jgi:hypothetical protein
MDTLPTKLQIFFSKTPIPNPGLYPPYQNALQAISTLCQAANPYKRSSSPANLFDRCSKILNLPPQADADALQALKSLHDIVRYAIGSATRSMGEFTVFNGLRDEAASLVREVQNVKQAVEHRLTVEATKGDEINSPPTYAQARNFSTSI